MVLHAAALEMAPRRMLDTLRRLGPVRVVLVGPEFGSLAHRLALVVGFDEVWPAGLPAATFQALLARAWAAPLDAPGPPTDPRPRHADAPVSAPPLSAPPAPPSRLQVSVDVAGGTCTVFDRVIVMPGTRLRLLDALVAAYPAAARRSALAGTAAVPGRRIDMTICRLRMALQASGIDTLVVESVRGVGYRLAVRAGAPCRAG